MTITVGNENIENLRLVLQPVFQVKGRIVQEDPAAAPSAVRVQLRGSRGFGSLQTTPTAADGTFTLTRVAPDTYRLAFVGLTGNVFVRSARFGGMDVLNSTLRIDREPADQLEVVLSQKTGSLDVVVTGRDQKPSPATTVVLIPEPAQRHRFELYRNATTDGARPRSPFQRRTGNVQALRMAGYRTQRLAELRRDPSVRGPRHQPSASARAKKLPQPCAPSSNEPSVSLRKIASLSSTQLVDTSQGERI